METRLHCRPKYDTSVRNKFKYPKEVSMNRRALTAVLLVLATSVSIAEPPGRWHWPWRWFWHIRPDGLGVPIADQLLTNNAGAKSVLFRSYDGGKIWTTTGFTEEDEDNLVKGFEYDSVGRLVGGVTISNEDGVESGNVCMASTDDRKFAAWGQSDPPDDGGVVVASQDLDTYEDDWSTTVLTSSGHYSYHQQVAIDAKTNYGVSYVNVAYLDSSDWEYGYEVRLMVAVSTDDGAHWEQHELHKWDIHENEEFDILNPVVAMDQYSLSGQVWLGVIAAGELIYWTSTNNGVNWSTDGFVVGGVDAFSAAVWDGSVFLCWSSAEELFYTWSDDWGHTWRWDGNAPWTIQDLPEGEYAAPNVEFFDESEFRVLVTYEYWDDEYEVSYVAEVQGRYIGGEAPTWQWFRWHGLGSAPADEPDTLWNPSLRLIHPGVSTPTRGCCHWSNGFFDPRWSWIAFGEWRVDYSVVPPPGVADNVGRNLLLDPEGLCLYSGQEPPYVVSGHISGQSPRPVIVNPGTNPALALDGDGNRWVSYLCDDTVWTMTGDGSYKAVFAGSTSAVPGQPSIICYPSRAGGVYVANVVFPVYDTSGGASKIMYARVDTSQVVLDTIESVANLKDSLPCVSIYKSDSLLVTWQHGTDSVLSSLLADYGTGTSGRPGAWASPSLVSANGYHAMSAFDEGGSVLNVVWTRNNGSNYAIQRATCDLATTTFGNWSQSATPGDTGTAEKANPVFAGLGVTCWQQKANGKWIIRGYVRGEETTLVANDTDAYHPHAVAESSAVSPSIDQVRVHLLYTAGVTFEVDSVNTDTGDVRYVCESLNVSHACSDATKANNGAKFLRKNGSDSLFSVYSDLDNAVVFAWSATGDTWQRSVLATGRDYPAIAEDSSGKRWVVARKPSQTIDQSIQEAYYRNGSSWTGPETLYSGLQGATLGPASLSGSSYTSSGIAYAAFLSTSTGGSQSLILAKFNGSVVSTYTVATGSTLGDPAITVEPYKADSDHIHVTWADNGTIKYRMDTDGRSTSIASNWTSTYDLTGKGTVGQHPSINADHDQIVVAWAQGSPADIYSRKRSTASAYNNWDAAVNLSNTAQDASDWPVIAMGDTVVVAWEETRTGGSDFDILASINFGDTLNIADNSTFSSYPQVLFQNKTSGDTAIPYLHTIWSECPEAQYYEVGYDKLNLKHPTGEGQQTASAPPIPVKPSLASCRPNPFRSHTQISYALPTAGNVSLRVYDVTGRTVRTLASGFQRAGSYSVSWDARDSRGKQVPYGIYFYRLDTPGFRSVKKAVVTR
jgi:hypothetical protein